MNQNKAVAIVVAIVVVGFFLGGLIYKGNISPSGASASVDSAANAQTSQSSQTAQAPQPSQAIATPQFSTPKSMTTTKDGLQIGDISLGTGATAKTGDHVYVHYIGTLTDGTKFDSSYDRGQPIDFTLGAGQVIAGWDEGIAGMKVGGQRKLVIPANLAYGSQAVGPIPANSTLVFEVQLMQIGDATAASATGNSGK